MNGLTLPAEWSDWNETTIQLLMCTKEELRAQDDHDHGYFYGLAELFHDSDTERLWELIARINHRDILKRKGWGMHRLAVLVDILSEMTLCLGTNPDTHILVLEARRRLAERA